MPKRDVQQLSLDNSLSGYPQRQIGVSLPEPLDVRLDVLVERITKAGERTTRKEVLAALVLAAPESGDELAAILKRFRLATAEAAVVEGVDKARFLEDEPAPPGPRSLRRAPARRRHS
jgi:hypothetical protein